MGASIADKFALVMLDGLDMAVRVVVERTATKRLFGGRRLFRLWPWSFGQELSLGQTVAVLGWVLMSWASERGVRLSEWLLVGVQLNREAKRGWADGREDHTNGRKMDGPRMEGKGGGGSSGRRRGGIEGDQAERPPSDANRLRRSPPGHG